MTGNNSSEGSVEARHNAIAHEKAGTQGLEQVPVHDRVPGHTNYYEKDGLRTYGDDLDHDHEPPVGEPSYESAYSSTDS